MKVLITGACGFLGSHLVRYIRDHTTDVCLYTTDCINGSNYYSDNFFEVDFTQDKQVLKVVEMIKPDCIIHLAGLFGSSDPLMVYEANVTSLLILLEAVRQICPSTILLAAGSAAEYGTVSSEQLPISENTPCLPVSIYGQTKHLATQIADFYHRVHGLSVMIFRPFQLIGKGVSPKLAPGAFAEQVLSALTHNDPVIKVGNLESFRDFLDVADAIKAIWLLCQKPAPGKLFNICSGRPTQMAELLDQMIKVAGAQVKVVIDPTKLRGNDDVSVVYGSYSRIYQHCGWEPKVSLIDSIRVMVC